MKRIKNLLLNDKFIIVLIIINSLIIFMQGFDFQSTFLGILFHIDSLITLVFVFELIFKLKEFGIKGYLSSKWNIFDAILIIISIPSLYFWIFGGATSFVGFLIVLRVFRVFKFFRFMRFLPDINNIINGVQRALKNSIVVLLGFIVYNFIIAVLSCSLYKDIAPEYFNNPLESYYTVFRIFTVEGWYEIPEQISENSSVIVGNLSKLYFIVILLTGGIFGLSLVNSVFVDAMVSDNNDELIEKVKSLEEKIDKLLEKE